MRDGISNLLNHQLVNGNGTAPNVSGLLHAVSATPSTSPANFDTFVEMVTRMLGEVDGLFAGSPRELRMVMRGDIYAIHGRGVRHERR